MKRLMTKLLNIPGVIVEDSRETEEILIWSVRVEKEGRRDIEINWLACQSPELREKERNHN